MKLRRRLVCRTDKLIIVYLLQNTTSLFLVTKIPQSNSKIFLKSKTYLTEGSNAEACQTSHCIPQSFTILVISTLDYIPYSNRRHLSPTVFLTSSVGDLN